MAPRPGKAWEVATAGGGARAWVPGAYQTRNTAPEMAITVGTKTALMRSARRWTGAVPDWASATSWAIWASWVSAPMRVARTTRRPPALTVAPTTVSPGPTSTGT